MKMVPILISCKGCQPPNQAKKHGGAQPWSRQTTTKAHHALPPDPPSSTQRPCMKRNMLADKRRDEVIPVVVAVMPTHGHRLPRRLRRSFENLRMQLRCEEVIGETLVDQNPPFKFRRRVLDQFARVILLPRFPIIAEIA